MKCFVLGCSKIATNEIIAECHGIKMKGPFCEKHYIIVRDADGYKVKGRKLKR